MPHRVPDVCSAASNVPPQTWAAEPVRLQGHASVTLHVPSLTLRNTAGSVILTRRQAAFLIALERCRPGVVTLRLLAQLAAQRDHIWRTGGEPAAIQTMRDIRAALRQIGVPNVFAVYWNIGWRLTEPVALVWEDA